MQLAASLDSSLNVKSRLRPFGSGRLFSWNLLRDVELAVGDPVSSLKAGADVVSGGLDPVIEHLATGALTMAFGCVARFEISFSEQTVRLVAAHPEADEATIDHFIDDHIAPRIISADGTLVLHGSATVIGSHIAVFLGQTGSGKSTLAASLHAAGYRLLGDDAVVISESAGTLRGESVYPSLRLYRESIGHVFRESVDTSAMAFYSEKLHVAANLSDSTAERFPLGAIYILTEGEEGVLLDRISPADACMALVENSFALDPQDPASAAKRMAQAARVAATIACYELAYPYDFGLLSEARSKVIASLAHVSNPA